MADDQYAAREAQYNDNLGPTIGKFCVACVEADSMAKDTATKRVLDLLGQDNVDIKAEVSLIGKEDALTTRINAPPIVLTKTNPLLIDRAEIEMDMTVSATTESETEVKSETKVETGVSAGWGPVKVGVKASAGLSVGHKGRRSSDYRSHVNAKVAMVQGEDPEGLSLLLDAVNKTVDTGLRINEALIGEEAKKLGASAGVTVVDESESEEQAAE